MEIPEAMLRARKWRRFIIGFGEVCAPPSGRQCASCHGNIWRNANPAAGTNPLDPHSMPGMLDGIAMKEMKEVRVPVLLREVKGGKARIERLDTPGMESWEQGTVVKGLPYRVTSVKQEVKADKHGVFSD